MPDLSLKLVAMASLSGVMNAVALALVLNAASDLTTGSEILPDLLLFIAAVALFAYSKKYSLDQTAVISEGMAERIRLRIMRNLRLMPLLQFESLSKGRIHSALSSDVQIIPQYTSVFMFNLASVVMLVVILGYLYFLSAAAFFIVCGSAGLCVLYFLSIQHRLTEHNEEANRSESAFYNNISGLLSGFKELKVNRRKADAFYEEELERLASSTSHFRAGSALITNHMVLLGSMFLFINMAGILFLLPKIDPDSITNLVTILAIVLFSLTPIADITSSIPMANRALAAIKSITALEADIKACQNDVEHAAETAKLPVDQSISFTEIELKGIEFAYPHSNGRKGFSLGPIDLRVHAGEIVFLVGGNGSGKSTLLKALTGLYPASSGRILLDSQVVGSQMLARYRSLFSVIFSDFFLFDRVIGADQIDETQVAADLEAMGLGDKVTFDQQGRFNHKDLSTGQRKRLALLLATMEERPIYIFDEWAADQDPEFRAFFYHSILPRLKEQGKTIFAATHDDHYFECADRVIELEYGKLRMKS